MTYDDFAEEFEAHATDSVYNAWYDRPAVLDLLGDIRGLRVLDVGCGPGLYAEELVRRGANVVGFDGSPNMARLARARLGDRARIEEQDLEEPIDWLEDGTFDRAVMALVISHVDDRVGALREIHRLLVPGGRLVVSIEHPTVIWFQKGGSYFAVEKYIETWRTKHWKVPTWRRPLQTTCDEFFEAGFLIERVVEPRPHEGMRDKNLSEFEELQLRPGFLAFRLLKPG